MRQMKKSVLLLFAAFPLLWGCSKDDDFLAMWKCNIQEQSLPAGDSARLFLPNAFSPNGDGLNDVFTPLYKDITNITFTVYDIRGQVIFKTTELGQGWDGLSHASEQYTICNYAIEAVSKSGNRLARCGSAYRLTCIPKGVSRDNLIFGDQFDPGMPEGYLHISAEELEDCK